jgi:hypothetical protein
MDDTVRIAVIDDEQAEFDVITESRTRRDHFIQSFYQPIIRSSSSVREAWNGCVSGGRKGTNRRTLLDEGDNT